MIGATGRLGNIIVKKLANDNFDVECMVRPNSNKKLVEGVPVRTGDLNDFDSLMDCLKGVDTVINTPNINGDYYENLIEACVQSNIRKCIFISSTSIFTKLNANTKEIKLKREKLITESGLNYTIIRPTMIYGLENDGNMSRLIKVLKKIPIFPILGSGEHLQQPVTYHDLADAVVLSVKKGDTSNLKKYNISGKTPLTFNQVIDFTAKALGKKVIKIHIPYKLSLAAVSVANKFGIKTVKAEQVERLNENKDFPHEQAREELGYNPIDFEKGITKQVKLLKEKGVI